MPFIANKSTELFQQDNQGKTRLTGTFHSIYRAAAGDDPGAFCLQQKNSRIQIICEGFSWDLRTQLPLIVTGKWQSQDPPIFEAIDIKFDNEDLRISSQYVAKAGFKGISTVRGRKIMQALQALTKEEFIVDSKNEGSKKDDDSAIDQKKEIRYREVTIQDIEDISESLKLTGQAKLQLEEAIAGIATRKVIREFVQLYKAEQSDTEILYGEYKQNAVASIKDRPYEAMTAGVSFRLCDSIAASFADYQPWNEKRIQALLAQMANWIKGNGSCCTRLRKAVEYLYRIQDQSQFPKMSRAMLASCLFASDDFVIQESERYGALVYSKQLYYTEVEIVSEIMRLQNSKEPLDFHGYRGKSDLDQYQIKAMDFMYTTGIKLLHGGPGAGKTTTIQEFIAEYKLLDPLSPVVCLCAPTGRAAVRIAESCNGDEKAVTIHKLIGVQPYTKTMTCRMNKENQLPKGLFILDEMSMTDEQLFLRFLQAVPNGSMIILSGDPDQLPSVESGTVLRDLIDSGVLESAELAGNHRQNGGSIVENYKKIKAGDTELIEDNSFIIVDTKSSADAINELAKLYKTYYTDDTSHFQILTSVRKGSLGKNRINRLISQVRKNETFPKIQGKRGYSMYIPGDRVLMTKNNYAKGYWNGDVGVITSQLAGGGYMASFYDGIRTIDLDSLHNTDYAFAMTIHKSQGSEYDVIAVVLDPAYPSMLYRSLFLTAVTRAKQKVFVISDRESIKKAIKTDIEVYRITGLCELLKAAMQQNKKHDPIFQ